MTDSPGIGYIITGTAYRDAVHIAVAPMIAVERLSPGHSVGLADTRDRAGYFAPFIGIVDPFLTEDVLPGQRFYLFLYPNTVTSLRHAWTHPAFVSLPPKEGESHES